MEKLYEVPSVELKSDDNWGYRITRYDDAIQIEYIEEGRPDQNMQFEIPLCYSAQFAEALLRIAKEVTR